MLLWKLLKTCVKLNAIPHHDVELDGPCHPKKGGSYAPGNSEVHVHVHVLPWVCCVALPCLFV